MVKFCLIGGKINKEVLSNNIEKYLYQKTNKEKPTVLFCPYASKNIKKTTLRFHELVKNINFNIIDLDFNNINQFDELLNQSDILYISGGVSDDLVDIFKKYNLDKILLKYINQDKIYAGVSAGAMLYTKISMGDKYMYSTGFKTYGYKMVECLDIIDISICPHYQNPDLIFYNDEIKKYNLVSFGIEEDSALFIEDNKYYVLKEEGNVAVYQFLPKKDYLMEDLKRGVVYDQTFTIRS